MDMQVCLWFPDDSFRLLGQRYFLIYDMTIGIMEHKSDDPQNAWPCGHAMKYKEENECLVYGNHLALHTSY